GGGPVGGDRLGGLPGRLRGAAHGPVQPVGRTARPGDRPPSGDLGDDGVLALRAAPAVGDRAGHRPRAVRAGAEPLWDAPGSRAEDQLARPAGCGADDGSAVLRHRGGPLARPGVSVPGTWLDAHFDRAVRPRRGPASACTQTLKLSLTLQRRRLYGP